LLAVPDLLKLSLSKIKEFVLSHVEEDEDILGEKGKAAFEQVMLTM